MDQYAIRISTCVLVWHRNMVPESTSLAIG
jgi:hypothetical protein